MTPEVVKFRRLPTTGSVYQSLALVVLLLIQFLASGDARTSDVTGVHLSQQQIIPGARITFGELSNCKNCVKFVN